MSGMPRLLLLLCGVLFLAPASAQSNRGYYRYPAIHGDTIVFTAEGDLWEVSVNGGVARRLTTHPGEETRPSFSPDGKTIAFSANYEGPTEVYTMPATGGLPTRRTFDGDAAGVVGWTPDGRILYVTRRYSTLPDAQLATIDSQNRIELVPLSQAAQGVYEPTGKTLFFTRLPFQGSHAKRYKGGTAQKLWKFTSGSEAVPLTADYDGTSKDAMWWNQRVYFLSDRDGTMNLWSVDENGKGLRQHTKHVGWDAQSPSLSNGKIVYQLGADLHLFDIATNRDRKLSIELASDFDHLRERWVKQPFEYVTSAHISHDGSKVVVTARGKVFVVPAGQGRLVNATARKPGRFRDARAVPDGKDLLVLSTETGEVELWKIPANGVGEGEHLTRDGKVLRWQAIPSPDTKWIVHQDKDNRLWLLNVSTKTEKEIAVNPYGGNSSPAFSDIRWSPDSRWIMYSAEGANTFERLYLYRVESGSTTAITSDRYNSFSAGWSPDGKRLYFLSDRSLKTKVFSPWGPRQPDPYFDQTVKIYEMALQKGLRSPFQTPDELHPDKPAESAKNEDKKTPVRVEIDLDGIASRIREVPVPPGNYRALTVQEKRLCWLDSTPAQKTNLQCLDIGNKGEKPETLLEDVRSYELSGDGKKMMVRKGDDIFVFDATVKEAALKTPKTLNDAKVNLKDWTFPVVPTEEFRELFLDAWRLHRDYFYDRNMHGIDWPGMRDKYLPLVDRVRDRQELSDLIAQLVGELSALHTSVRGGDIRRGPDQIELGALGARLERSAEMGGYVVKHIYQSDPDRPDLASPLAHPDVDLREGDVILKVNGRDTLSAADIGELLRNHAKKQVLLTVRTAEKAETRDVVVTPITVREEADLRYHEWEYTRRLIVEKEGNGKIGYVHLRAMGPNDIDQWAEHFYPVFNREGLIIDVRHNRGGNIDSWLLGKLLRKAWFYWQPRTGQPTWNMQYAFRGHIAVLCNEWTASDGEAFTEGFRRLGLGKVIGTRTWGGEIWLTSSNTLADHGIASAAEIGVYGPEGKWLIEGHGVEPDIVVDNLPHATFNGKDAQLEAAIAYLSSQIREKPVKTPPAPPYPDKSLDAARKTAQAR